MTSPASNPFTPEFFRFFRELKKNNNRPWFQKNKIRYDRDVLGACLAFVEAMGPGVNRISPQLVADPRPVGGSLMRIYRDIRFSRDKSPYRTSMGIHFFHRQSERHDGAAPGFFLHLAPGGSFVASGAWMPSPPDLAKIRQAIVKGGRAWEAAKAVGLAADESALKRVPPGFDPSLGSADDLRRKNFVTMSRFTDFAVTSSDFPRRFLAECRRMQPLNRFLANAVRVAY